MTRATRLPPNLGTRPHPNGVVRTTCLARACASCIIFVAAGGCAASPAHYRAASVPYEALARPTTNVQMLDLTRIASAFPANERVGAGDILEITLSSGLGADETTTFPARVDDEGRVGIPVVGVVDVAGMELSECEVAIGNAAKSRELFRTPHVTATMKRRRLYKITVVGAVKKPGLVELPAGGCDLLAAITAAGGLDEDAGTLVEVRNNRRRGAGVRAAGDVAAGPPAEAVARFDLAEEVRGGAAGAKFLLGDGAVVRVERRDADPLQVIGLVRTPGSFEFPLGRDLRVLDAVSLAGGIASPVADKVVVIRATGEDDPAVVAVSISKAKRSGAENLLLRPGDVVSVEQTPTTVLLDTIRFMSFGLTGTSPLL